MGSLLLTIIHVNNVMATCTCKWGHHATASSIGGWGHCVAVHATASSISINTTFIINFTTHDTSCNTNATNINSTIISTDSSCSNTTIINNCNVTTIWHDTITTNNSRLYVGLFLVTITVFVTIISGSLFIST